jgi:hypothetical protein
VGSNTTRSRDRLEAEGYAVDVVESYNYFTKKRKDLYNGFDLIGCGPDGVVFLQTTSRDNIAARVRKIAELPAIDAIRKAGVTLLVDGWDQPDGPRTKWRCKTVDVS